jgi:hypothetical protein
MEERMESSGNYGNWNSALKYLKKCFGDKHPMSDVTIETCSKFRLFLETKARTKSNTPLSQNSKYSYLNKLKACLKLAYKDRLINENVSEFITYLKNQNIRTTIYPKSLGIRGRLKPLNEN